MAIFVVLLNECNKERHPSVKSENVAQYYAVTQNRVRSQLFNVPAHAVAVFYLSIKPSPPPIESIIIFQRYVRSKIYTLHSKDLIICEKSTTFDQNSKTFMQLVSDKW